MSNRKSKIVFIVIYPQFIEYYFNKSVLDKLLNIYEVQILLPEKLRSFVPDKYINFCYFLNIASFNHNQKKLHFIFELSAWKNRKRSISFKFRETRTSQPYNLINVKKYLALLFINGLSNNSLQEVKKEFFKTRNEQFDFQNVGIFKKIVPEVLKGLYILVRRFLIRVLASYPIFTVCKYFALKIISTPPELNKFFSENTYDLVVYVSSGFEPIAYHVPKILNTLKRPSLMVADNWDNLSSKTSMWELPSHVATWGTQSSEHAVRIQGFKPEQVSNIGTARFSGYRTTSSDKLKSHFSFDYVLFVGTILDFNEYSCLKIISKEILSNPDIYGDLRIVYRPHPFAQNRNSARHFQDFDNVLLDPQIKQLIKNNFSRIYPEIDYLPSLIFNSQFVIGGMTSFIIDASIFGKKYIGLIHKEKYNLTSPETVYINYEHFKGIDVLPNLFLCDDLDFLRLIIRSVWRKPNLAQDQIDSKLGYFYNISEAPYYLNLSKVIDECINFTL